MSKKSGLGKFALGAGIGAALALLFAPKKGSDLRNDIKKKIDAFMKDVEDLSITEIKEEFTKKVEEIKEGIEDLAKEKGTPILEGVAEDLREKTVSVAKEVVEKLEKK